MAKIKIINPDFLPHATIWDIGSNTADYLTTSADYHITLLETITSMFNFYDMPESINPNFILNYALTDGMCCIIEQEGFNKGLPVVARFKPVGHPNSYGIGEDAIILTGYPEVIEVKDWESADNLAVFFLNRIYKPDLTIPRYAKTLTEAQTTINTILLNARYAKLIGVKDEKTKMAVDRALENMEVGKPTTVVDEASCNSFVGDNGQPINSIDLFDVRNNDMLQYLSKFIDDTERQFFSKYGLSSFGSSKMAQQNSDEITSGMNRSMVIPHMRYEQLQKFIEECNSKFGWSASVTFSECWQNELARCSKDVEAEEVEEITEVPEEAEKEVVEDEKMEHSESIE